MGGSCSPARAGGAGSAAAGWWAMDADGANATLVVSQGAIGVSPEDLAFTYPAWQPIGGPAIVPPPWTAGDGDRRRTAGAHAVPDTDPGSRARVQLDRHRDRR